MLQSHIIQLINGVKSTIGLIDESYGVDGLHLNGDVAPWGSLREGGHYEDWLIELDKAYELIENGTFDEIDEENIFAGFEEPVITKHNFLHKMGDRWDEIKQNFKLAKGTIRQIGILAIGNFIGQAIIIYLAVLSGIIA